MVELLNEYGGILPCGGMGTRLKPINNESLPKSLFKVAGRELISYSIDALPPHLVGRLVFAVGYGAENIKIWAEAAGLPQAIDFSEQTEPGVLGAIVSASDKVREDSMVTCNTDEIRFGLSLADVLQFHEEQGTLATMVATYSDRVFRHRLIRTKNGIVTSSRLKPEEYKADPGRIGLVNTGFLVIKKQAMEHFDATHSRDWSGIIDPLTDAGQLSAFVSPEMHYFNVGTPEEYQEAGHFLEQYS